MQASIKYTEKWNYRELETTLFRSLNNPELLRKALKSKQISFTVHPFVFVLSVNWWPNVTQVLHPSLTFTIRTAISKLFYLQNLILRMTDWPAIILRVTFFVSQSPFTSVFSQNHSNCISLWPRLSFAQHAGQTKCAWPDLLHQINSSWAMTPGYHQVDKVSCFCSKGGS